MAQALRTKSLHTLTPARVALLALACATAAVWLRNKRGEVSLHQQTAERLRPLPARGAA